MGFEQCMGVQGSDTTHRLIEQRHPVGQLLRLAFGIHEKEKKQDETEPYRFKVVESQRSISSFFPSVLLMDFF